MGRESILAKWLVHPEAHQRPLPSEPAQPPAADFAPKSEQLDRRSEGAFPAESFQIESEPGQAEQDRARSILNGKEVRFMALEGGETIGLWSDLDGLEIRCALRLGGLDRLPVCYLDGAGVPARFKLRRVEGEPVPMNVLAEMERLEARFLQSGHHIAVAEPTSVEYPWTARDRMLKEMGWRPEGISWEEWKAAALNRLFHKQGAVGSPGHITSKTVSDGERKWRTRNPEPSTIVRSEPQREGDKVWTPNRQKIVAHNWAKWEKWQMQSPAAADQYRAAHQDETGDFNWLLEFENFEVPRDKNSWIVEQCRDKEERRLLSRVRDDAQAHPDKYGLGTCALCGEAAPWIAVFTTTQKLVRGLDRAPDRKWVLVFGLCLLHRECGDAASQVEAQLMGESLFAGHGGVVVDAETVQSRRVPDAGGEDLPPQAGRVRARPHKGQASSLVA
jgi:hypothetical protein